MFLLGLPFVMDPWKTTEPHKVVGLQIQMLLGENHKDHTSVRVSTDQRTLVIETPLSEFVTDPKIVFGWKDPNNVIANFISMTMNLFFVVVKNLIDYCLMILTF